MRWSGSDASSSASARARADPSTVGPRVQPAAWASATEAVLSTFLLGQGNLLARTGRFDEAQARLQEGIDRFAEIGDERLADACRSEVAHAVRRAGDIDGALALYRETIQRWVRTGNRGAVAHQLESMAFAFIVRGDPDRAARLLGAAAALREAARSPMTQAEQIEHEDWLARLRVGADPATVEAGLAAGRRLSIAEAVALASAVDQGAVRSGADGSAGDAGVQLA